MTFWKLWSAFLDVPPRTRHIECISQFEIAGHIPRPSPYRTKNGSITSGTYLSEQSSRVYNSTTMGLNIDIRKLPADLTSAYILSFLVNHDWDDVIAPVLSERDKKALANDQKGIINLDAACQSFTIKLPTINNRSEWKYENPGSE